MSYKDGLINHLKTRRQTLGWSLEQVGDRCGINERFLEQWEHGAGSPRLDAVENWAAALGLRVSLAAADGEVRRGLQVDWHNRRLSVDGTPVRLTPMEWKALERLAAVQGEVVPHQELFRHLYGDQPYRAQSTAIRVLITKLRRLLPVRIEAQWGRGYVLSGMEPSTPHPAGGSAAATEPRSPAKAEPARKSAENGAPAAGPIVVDAPAFRRKLVEITHSEVHRAATAPVARPQPCRAEELSVIERFLAERGVTRCPDVATIQHSPLPTLVWDKVKRKWVRPPMASREAS
jgi:transcriptional regulator with XRE-family HTH domain